MKFVKYKWEFLRRKPEYISDWDEFMKCQEEVFNRKVDFDRYMDVWREFCTSWKIRYPFDANLSYDDLVNELYRPIAKGSERIASAHEKKGPEKEITDDFFDRARMPTGKYVLSQRKGLSVVDIQRGIYDALFAEDDPKRPVGVVGGWADTIDGSGVRFVEDRVAESGQLTVRINLNYSRNKLIKEFKNVLAEWELLYKDAHKKFHYRKFCEERGIHHSSLDDKMRKEFIREYKEPEKQ